METIVWEARGPGKGREEVGREFSKTDGKEGADSGRAAASNHRRATEVTPERVSTERTLHTSEVTKTRTADFRQK